MKKVVYFLPVLMALCLTGCGEKMETGTIKCTLSTNDVVNNYQLDSSYTINYKGETVESVVTNETVTTESKDLLDYFETTLEQTYSQTNKAYGGYTYNISKTDTQVSSDVTIDYNKMNISKFVEDQPTLKNYVKDNKLLTDGLKELYESMGATCK